jgi:hypothetical protein
MVRLHCCLPLLMLVLLQLIGIAAGAALLHAACLHGCQLSHLPLIVLCLHPPPAPADSAALFDDLAAHQPFRAACEAQMPLLEPASAAWPPPDVQAWEPPAQQQGHQQQTSHSWQQEEWQQTPPMQPQPPPQQQPAWQQPDLPAAPQEQPWEIGASAVLPKAAGPGVLGGTTAAAAAAIEQTSAGAAEADSLFDSLDAAAGPEELNHQQQQQHAAPQDWQPTYDWQRQEGAAWGEAAMPVAAPAPWGGEAPPAVAMAAAPTIPAAGSGSWEAVSATAAATQMEAAAAPEARPPAIEAPMEPAPQLPADQQQPETAVELPGEQGCAEQQTEQQGWQELAGQQTPVALAQAQSWPVDDPLDLDSPQVAAATQAASASGYAFLQQAPNDTNAFDALQVCATPRKACQCLELLAPAQHCGHMPGAMGCCRCRLIQKCSLYCAPVPMSLPLCRKS